MFGAVSGCCKPPRALDNRWATPRAGGGTAPAPGRFSTTAGADAFDAACGASNSWSAKDIGLPQFAHLMGGPLWPACRSLVKPHAWQTKPANGEPAGSVGLLIVRNELLIQSQVRGNAKKRIRKVEKYPIRLCQNAEPFRDSLPGSLLTHFPACSTPFQSG